MPYGQNWRGVPSFLPVITADQTAVTAAGDAVMWTANQTQLPGQFFTVSSMMKLTVQGKITTAASTPGTATFTLRYGQATTDTSLGASAAISYATSQTNVPFTLEVWVTCRAIGSSGTLLAIGRITSGAFTVLVNAIPSSAPAATTVDTTAQKGLIVSYNPSAATNSLTVMQVALEFLN